MKLNEILNKPYDMRVKSSDHLNWAATFRTDDNIDYVIYIENNYSEWEVIFKINSITALRMDKSPIGILNTGDAFRIFATVLNFIQKFIEKIKPTRIVFSAKEPSRKKIIFGISEKIL